jgi:general secretion pathway protein A
MYFKYYGLSEKPFSLSADPRYIYYSNSHKECFAQMAYTATQDSGFMILTGEVGTGKTIMINALIDRLPKRYRVAKIYHTALNPEGLVQNICKEFGLQFLDSSLSQLILKIQDFLKWTHDSGEKSILILDEAQNLNPDTLEEIRLLSNFEAAHQKILQVFLAGQPELEEKLWAKNLRQLRERVSLRYHLKKLDRQESEQYIRHRLKVAGLPTGRSLFADSALEKIYALSDGIPRRINILCDNALLMGYAENYKIIDAEMVRKVGYYNQVEEKIPEMIERSNILPGFSSRTEDGALRHTAAHTATPAKSEIPKSGGNGTMDYSQFQDYMTRFLDDNQLYITRRPGTGKQVLNTILIIILLIVIFLGTLQIASYLGLFK